MFKKIIQVYPQKDFTVYVYFDDGKVKRYDCSDLITQGVFKQISNIKDFIEKCTVINGTLAWDIGGNFNEYKCLDLDPESIYIDSIEVDDPMSKVS